MIIASGFLAVNQPSDNIFRSTGSILPERFNSTSLPIEYSIVSRDLNSTSEPEIKIEREVEEGRSDEVQPKRGI